MRAEVKEGRRHVAESLVNHMKNYDINLNRMRSLGEIQAEDHVI